MDEDNQIKKTDQTLIHEALQSPNAFGSVVDRYEKQLRRYIARLGCRNSEDVDDVLQEIFLKVYINLNEYDERLKFSSWIYRIAHNETISFFRKKSVRPSPVLNEEELAIFDLIVDDTNIIEELNKKIDGEFIRRALLDIDLKYKDVLVLKFIEDKSYDEISDILKIPMGTVGTLIHRGKTQLREILIRKNMHI